jgi:hypothetical protein
VRNRCLWALTASLLGACSAVTPPAPLIACADLTQNFKSAGVAITSATLVASAPLPEYCRVEGVIRPEPGSTIRFATNIPKTNWNGRFIMLGNGGYAGGAPAAAGPFIADGYATAATDTGHVPTNDGTVFYNNRAAEIDYGYRAVHLTTDVAKAIIGASKGKQPDYAYFNGCSTGGRQGLMSVQRYPADFDGVIAGAPAFNLTGLAIEQNWSLRQFWDNNFAGNISGKVNLLSSAVKAACSDSEGIIADAGACAFDPAALVCAAGTDTASCLTPAQVTAVKAVYGGPVSSSGKQWYPGKPRGSEASWASWLVADSRDPGKWAPLQGGFGFSFVNNLFFENDPPKTYKWSDFNFETDPAKGDFMARILNATDTNLTAFNQRKGKLILYHGTGDGLITYQSTEKYYRDVKLAMGADTTEKFARLFLVPGMDHCDFRDRGGLSVADWMKPLVNWVENGRAPDAVPASSRSSNPVKFTRQVCAWPKKASYVGSGSRLEASSWSCS